MTTHRLVASQLVPRPLDEVFPFFATPENLARLTPPGMRFEFRSDDREMRPASTIDYRLRPLPLLPMPVGWQTRIETLRPAACLPRRAGRAARTDRGITATRSRPSTAGPSSTTRSSTSCRSGRSAAWPTGSPSGRSSRRSSGSGPGRSRRSSSRRVSRRPGRPSRSRAGPGSSGAASPASFTGAGTESSSCRTAARAARGPLPDDVEIREADVADATSLRRAGRRRRPRDRPRVPELADGVARRGQTFELVDARRTERLVAAARRRASGGSSTCPGRARHRTQSATGSGRSGGPRKPSEPATSRGRSSGRPGSSGRGTSR